MANGGRATGSRNRGFFFRKGRGWVASDGNRAIPLEYEDGVRIRDRNARIADVKAAYDRYLAQKRREAEEAAQKASAETAEEERWKRLTVADACRLFLDFSRANHAPSTHRMRADALFDFCTGFPGGLRNKKKRPASERLHDGYGDVLVSEMIPLYVDKWLADHPRWRGCLRSKIKSVLRAFNYCVQAGVLEKNPIKGYKPGKDNIRRTYITPEQEEACYKHSRPAFALALKVCIRTGARYGCEFAKLTADHVFETEKGMEWRFSPENSKNRKLRIIRITDEEIIEIVRTRVKRYPTGPLFRTVQGKPWTVPNLSSAFRSLKNRLARKGIHLDEDACMYSCRHTYAKRVLQGYWTGKKCNIETLCKLMGNSREICWEVYSEWCDSYTEPLWEAA